MTIIGHSSLLATQEAVYAALKASTAFTSICAGPFDPAPLNQAFPYAAFGEHMESNWYQFQRPSKQIEFVIDVYTQKTLLDGYQDALGIIDAITSIIEAKTLTLTGGTFANAENGVMFVQVTKIKEPDGLTRHVEGRWKIWNNAI